MGFEVGLLVEHPELSEPRAVLVDADPDAAVGQLLAACSQAAGLRGQTEWTLARTGQALEPAQRIETLELRWGDRLTGCGAARVEERPDTPWVLRVVGGPFGGVSVPLAAGTHTVGRGADCDVVLDDPSVSSTHLALTVTAGSVEARDLGSTNGTLVDGHRLAGAQTLAEGAVVEVGGSLLSIGRPLPIVRADIRYREGRLLFNRPPRVTPRRAETNLALPDVPRKPEGARLPLAASLIPLAFGVVMAAALHQTNYLFFCLMSPAMAVTSYVTDHRSGRRNYRRDEARFTAAMDGLEVDAAGAHAEAIRVRRGAAPNPTELIGRATQASPRLWERRRDDPDFLALRVGLADQPSSLAWKGTTRVEDGDDDGHAARLTDLLRRHDSDLDVPVIVDLNDLVLGVAGPLEGRERLARALLVQAATLHSPRDLAIVALVPPERAEAWQWLAWLPHLRSLDDDIAIANNEDEMSARLRSLASLVNERKDSGRWSPNVLLFVAGDVTVPRAVLADVLAEGPSCGVTGLVLAGSANALPGECGAVAEVESDRGQLVVAATGERFAPLILDGVPVAIAEEAARSLAPVLDVSTVGRGGDLPRRALLLDLLGLSPPLSSPTILEGWRRTPGGLGAVIGVGAAGPFEVDLRRDGPHALVAGTTGSGKSELLQTLVASLAVGHPPDRLTFVLVDYKGGAAFKDCVRLPHVVGFFTDLDGHLAHRALISLNAELRRREQLLGMAGAKDLVEMEQRQPERAPASLVVVIDEFAFLKREVPEFVDGVVDIAQRGRSLGVHLVLATQQPSGVVDEKIRANTNLRVALRVASDADSSDVIGQRDAGHIPRSLPGRSYVRTGHAQIDPVQTAYVGAVRPEVRPEPEVSARSMPGWVGDGVSGGAAGPERVEGDSDLQRLVDAAAGAALEAALRLAPPPWLPPLPAVVDLGESGAGVSFGDGELASVIGVVDEPDAQRQRPYALDLGAAGHLALYGTGGAGKTTFLRTLAAGLASRLTPDDLHIYGIDAASRGLLALEALPQCGGVVTADDAERLERLIAMLEALISERQARLGATGMSSLAEYRQIEALPWVLLLVDGYPALRNAYDSVDGGQLLDRFHRLVSEGRAAGLHVVIGCDRRAGFPLVLSGVVSERIVLRQADPDDYGWLGLAEAARGATLPPGRGFVTDGVELQVCVLGDDPSAGAQARRLAALGEALTGCYGRGGVPRVETLPEQIRLADVPPTLPGEGKAVFGLDATTMAPAVARLDLVPTLLVTGPDRSGRTNALAAVTRSLVAGSPGLECYLLSPLRRSWDGAGVTWADVASDPLSCQALAEKLADLAARRAAGGGPGFLVVVDDGDELADGPGSSELELVVRRGRDAGVMLVGAGSNHAVRRAFSGWLPELRRANHALLLVPDLDLDGDLAGVRLPRRAGRAFPPGRGFLVQRGTARLVQVALA